MGCNNIQSSSCSSQMICKYDVFVSFRGDTRNNFIDHLFGALHRNGILTFKDDINLRKGESIAPELLQAIEESRILIVVFSKNYASSTWCLQELAKILNCVQISEKHVLPIFYDVDPSQVRKQSEDYEKAFAEHEERFKDDSEKMIEVKRWREALTQVANLSGWDIGTKPQNAEIEKIVEEILSILDQKISSLQNDLVGMQSPVKELEKLLHLDSIDDVRVVGIYGMGGIGKTTLATILYDKISLQYDACCFIDDVSKIYRDYGPIGAQRQLLCQTLNQENSQICNLYHLANLMRSRLCKLRALIVLDNVDEVGQLEKLAVSRERLGAGSRIIIISRDKHILKECGVDVVYNVPLLNANNALKLFSRKAFKGDVITRDYVNLAYDAIKYANGLPLAVKVLGSFLFGRDVSEWRSALTRLRENPRKDIMNVLRLSFDGLEEMEKEIFLDIACFFPYRHESYVKEVLDFRGFYPEIGIRVLIDKSLITKEWGMIDMHNLLKELGRSIVREKSPKEPRKWSRLWDYKDLHNVMLENMASENLEAVVMQRYPKIPETTMRVDALSKMSHLKLLILWNVNFSGSLNHLSNNLGYLTWDKYPFQCLPPSFHPDKLVELILPHSEIKQLWEGSKPLYNLRRMDLSHSKNLIKMPDFRDIPNLERLNLEGCIKLVQIDSSIGILKKLTSLNLKNCKTLIKMPDFREIPNLEVLHLEGCIKLGQIDLSIGILKKLFLLNLKNCKNLVSIPNNIFCLNSLEYLDLSGCSKLLNNKMLEKPRHGEHLEKLELNESIIQSQPTSSIFKVLMLPLRCMYSPRHEDSVGFLLPSLPRFQCLEHLDISFCNLLQIPDTIGLLHSLESLNLGGNNFVILPSSIKGLSKLTHLNLEHCKQLKYLPELPLRTVLPVSSESSFGKYGAALYIFDCPNLSEMERCYGIAFSWMKQVLEVHVQSSFTHGLIRMVVPGSQIPRWFDKQNVGNSISMDPSPIMHDKNWIGVACCVTFVAHDDPTNLRDTRFPCIAYGFQSLGLFRIIPIRLEKDLVTVESDHLLLLFFTREEFIDNFVSYIAKGTHNLDGIKLETIIEDPQGLHLEVKMCGYRWIFKEDLEQLNPKQMHSRDSSFQKHKFLTNDLPDH